MLSLPFKVGVIHFVGIGGIGMSGIAEVMNNLGYKVQGSDLADSANVKRLRAMGVPVFIGHEAGHLGTAEVVVISSAVKSDNPELIAARAHLLPVLRRAEMLAELMRLKWCIAVAGTHGKTTTTSIIAALVDRAGLDPTVINGGIINAYGSNARLGDGDWMVVEADESDGTFLNLPATIAVVTNLDPEHLDHYGNFDALKTAFQTFLETLPFYGFGIACLDDPDVQTLIGQVTDRKIVTYGLNLQADVRAFDVTFDNGGAQFSVSFSGRARGETRELSALSLPMPGEHNVLNALAAIAVANEMDFSGQVIREGLEKFAGVKRRFTRTGSWNGVTIIDDYGHHPVEIAAVLKAARVTAAGRVIAIVQPHRYSRLRDLFEEFCTCFNDADVVVVTPVYAAGEAPIEGISGQALVAGLRDHGHRNVLIVEGEQDLAGLVRDQATDGDYVICLGAGNISAWANALPERLKVLDERGSGTV